MKYFGFIFIGIILYSCSGNGPLTQEEIAERLSKRDFSVYKQLPSCSCDDLTEKDGLYYKSDSLYTGNCHLNYPNIDAKYEIRQLYKGELYGNRILLSPKGDTLSQNEYKQGDVIREDVGTKEVCNCDELEKIERADGKKIAKYYNEPFTGICQSFFPAPNDDKIYLEAKYEKGVLNGVTKIYDKNGKVILKERYSNGEKQ
tara:strand:+ start:31686 stop:32288 length:603 start_codon:yes stop_codon:yes gene_type:complete